ncbi:MAG: signal peptidase I [Gammaproteobacteria bacterium]|nr:signal peptidase I [Gammaproteobacteria bacterium]
MYFDFPTLLVLLTLITGAITLLDSLVLKKKREKKASEHALAGEGPEDIKRIARPSTIVDTARSLFPVILIVLVLRSFIVEPFRIPSGSMMPTLVAGDFILVNKFAYGLRLPVLHTKILDTTEPKRGDVIVFRYPENPRDDYIKRVVGVPGDHIVYRNKVLFVNGEPAEQLLQGEYVGQGATANMTGASVRTENLTGVKHRILVNYSPFDREVDFVVPEGEYFVLGDNRDNSRDSRYWGTVPEENLVGKAFVIWMHWDPVDNHIDWHRLFDTIH